MILLFVFPSAPPIATASSAETTSGETSTAAETTEAQSKGQTFHGALCKPSGSAVVVVVVAVVLIVVAVVVAAVVAVVQRVVVAFADVVGAGSSLPKAFPPRPTVVGVVVYLEAAVALRLSGKRDVVRRRVAETGGGNYGR